MTKKRIMGGAAALAAALMMTAAAFAQHGPGGPGGHHGPGGPGRHGGPGGMLGHLSQVLDLSDAQKAQIKQHEDSFKESTKGLHEQLGKAGPGGPFEALKNGGAFDEAAVRAAAQARANLHVELEVAHARFFSQVYAVLTAEQKAKLAELHKQRQERHGPGTPPPGGEDGGR